MPETQPQQPPPGEEVDDLLDQVLAAPEGSWSAALDDLCRTFPEQAGALRRRFGYLQRCGVVEQAAVDGSTALAQPTQGGRFGPYDLGPVLGHGAMGIVFRAVDRTSGATVALKIIRPELLDDEAARRRFVHEGQLAARVQHANLCLVHSVGEIEGTPFLAMDLLAGETLASRLERARRHGKALAHGWPGIVAMFEKVARALGSAHAAGLVHRDVKPGNLMIGADGEPVLFDFGLAFSAATTRLTRTGSVLGTPAYMPPEQVRGTEHVTPRADVYALGASLYEALSLRPPFGLLEREALYRRILHDDPDDLRRLAPHLPKALGWVVHRCLEKDPRRRYADANEVAEDLARVRHGQRPAARPPGPPRRLARMVRRHPVAASLLLAATLGLVGLSLFAWQARQRAAMQSVLVALSAERSSGRNAVPAAIVAREEFAEEPTAATRSALLASLLGLHQTDEVRGRNRRGWSADLPDNRLLCAMSGTGEDPGTMASVSGTWSSVVLQRGWSGAVAPDGQHYALIRSPPLDRALIPRSPPVDQGLCPLLFTTSGAEIPLALRRPIVVEQNWLYYPRPVQEFDGDRLYVGDKEGWVSVFDMRGGLVADWQPHEDSRIHSLWTLRDGRVLTVAVDGGNAQEQPPQHLLRDVRVSSAEDPRGSVLFTSPDGAVQRAAFSGDRSRLFVGLGSPPRIACVALDGGAVTETDMPTPRHYVTAIAADNTGQHAVVGTGGHSMVFLLEPGGTQPGGFRLHPLGPMDSDPVAAAFGPASARGPARFAVGEWGGSIHVYALPDGRETAVLQGHEQAVAHLRFSADGSELVSASWDGTVRRWRLDLPGLPSVCVKNPVNAVAWLPDGEHFLVATNRFELSLFERGGRRLHTEDSGGASGTAIVAAASPGHPLAREETVLAFGGERHPLAFWACRPSSASPLRALEIPIPTDGPLPHPMSLRFTPDRHLVVGAHRGGVEIFSAEGRRVWSAGPDERHTDHVTGLDVSPSGRFVASAGGSTLKLWEWQQGPELRAAGALLECACYVTAVAFPPDDDNALLVGLGDGRVLWFDVATRTPRDIGHHDGRVRAVAFTNDGTLMLSSGHDGVAKVWTRDREPFVELPHGGVVHAAAFSPDGRHVLTGSLDRTARIWPVTDEELKQLADKLPFRGLEPDERERRFGGR